ncbi:protein FAM83G-like [Vanacampus margaritifer]
MALSQIQCLDDHHVNWRVSQSKPEFFYSEDQRLAIEKLIAQGRGAFTDYLHENKLREFLSEPELERITHTAEIYRPGYEHHQRPETPGGHTGNTTPGSGEDGALDGEVSLQYWPDRSEASVAELDLGWPEAISYRGVTRVTVYTQPPAYGQSHIKEVVRKSIASAQKVIAVVMDAFTDVDIFQDLLDAAYRRKVPVYIIIDIAAVPSFLSMCGRADMHRGHLKNLRVRCCGGVEFFTRSAQKLRGSLSQRFILVDGDRAISGSYSFTWSSSRLDRNLITMITGQSMETFDFQFRELFLLSRSVSLSKVPLVDEPVPDPLPQAAPVVVPASVAKKLINPKYALVASPTSSNQNSSNKNSQLPAGLKIPKGRLKEVSEEPQLHPALVNMEKAYLIPYLPTWPEPDPPSDVIGFINIRDEKRANQVHLQRSERFTVSQAIRFSSSLTQPSPTEESGQDDKGEAEPATGDTSAPEIAPNKKQQEHATPKKDSVDAAGSRGPPQQQPDALLTQETQQTHAPPAEPQPADNPGKTPDTPAAAAAPPVPKRRTLHLVIDPTPSDQPAEAQVTLVKIDNTESSSHNDLVRVTSKEEGADSGSNGNGSQDSTKVMCDRAAADHPSSASTVSEEEYFDCAPQQPAEPLADRGSAGSGRGHRLMDGVNMMARLSQSMLDLREPHSQTEDSASLIRQSQQLRRQGNGSSHKRFGQMFPQSRSPGRDGRLRGTKVVIAKPGSFHRPQRAAAPVIGGHRYWHGQTLQPDAALTRPETRSSRSPRRHSPSYRKGAHTSSPTGGLAPQSKLNNFRHLKVRGGATQKKVTQNNNRASR